MGAVYAAGVFVGRYQVAVHPGVQAERAQWWTVRLLPARTPFAGAESGPDPTDVVSGNPWARIVCGVQGSYGDIVVTWPQAHIATFNVFAPSVSVVGLLSQAEIQASLSARGPDLTAQVIPGQCEAPTGGRWTITGGPDVGDDEWVVAIPPGARAYRISPRSVSEVVSTVRLSQFDRSVPAASHVRQVDPPLRWSADVVAVASRICDAATHIIVETVGVDPLAAPGVYDLTFDVLTPGNYDAV